MKHRKLNGLLLLLSLIGGAVGFIAGELLLGALLADAPRFVAIGLYFGVMALCIGLACLLAELISPRLNGTSWRQRYSGLSWKLLLPATLVLLFVVGGGLQLVYGLNIGGIKKVKDIVLVIDNSGSMQQTDPDNERYTAAKQMIADMESNKRVAVVIFSDTAQLLQPFISVKEQASKDAVYAAIDSLEPTQGGTDIGLALGEAMETIRTKDATRRGTMVILLSDGFSESGINEQIAAYQEQSIPVNTIGLSLVNGEGSGLLRQIADSTGGSYYDVADAAGLSLVFTNIYKTIDDRTLVTERNGRMADSMYYAILRIVSLLLIGAAIGVSLGLMFDNRFLAKSFGVGGAVGGVLAGGLLEFGLTGHSFRDGAIRLAAALLLAAVIALFTLIVPISENNNRVKGGGNSRGGLGGRSSSAISERTKDTRSHGF